MGSSATYFQSGVFTLRSPASELEEGKTNVQRCLCSFWYHATENPNELDFYSTLASPSALCCTSHIALLYIDLAVPLSRQLQFFLLRQFNHPKVPS